MVQDCRESHNRGADLWGAELSCETNGLNWRLDMKKVLIQRWGSAAVSAPVARYSHVISIAVRGKAK